METVFVYGTLRAGHPNEHMMNRPDIQFFKADSIKAERCRVGEYLPGIREGNGEVDGELYHVSTAARVSLDTFEGHPDFYERREVVTNGGVRAWSYWPNPRYIKE